MSTEKNNNMLELMTHSLSDSGVSSSEHAISSFASEAANVAPDEYEIPSSYNVDTLRCLGVNVNTVYVYWEITEAMLAAKGVLGRALLVKLCDGNSEDELLNFFITDRLSSRFLSVHLPNRTIYAKVGALVDGVFVELLRSNSFFTPSDEITMSNDEHWMSKSERFEEILRASAPWGFNQSSSFGIVKELEFLHKNSESARTNVSSSSYFKKETE